MGIETYLEEQGITVLAGFGWKSCKCPYHSDRNASASVNVEKGRFHCFACDINEDLIGLIQRDTGVSFVEAKQEAESKYGSGLPQVSGSDDTGSPLLSRFERDRLRGRSIVRAGAGAGWREGL